MSEAVVHVHRGGKLVALVGNPNCGKTALFNGLTGSHQKVANYAGVTVERKEGRLLSAAGKTLDWSCTCTGKPDNFCKHCAALAIVIWEKAPKRRG